MATTKRSAQASSAAATTIGSAQTATTIGSALAFDRVGNDKPIGLNSYFLSPGLMYAYHLARPPFIPLYCFAVGAPGTESDLKYALSLIGSRSSSTYLRHAGTT